MTATAIVTGPDVPCDADNCGKQPGNLALPSLFFHDDEADMTPVKKMVDLIKKINPGKKVTIEPDETSHEPEYQKLPFKIGDWRFWVEKLQEAA